MKKSRYCKININYEIISGPNNEVQCLFHATMQCFKKSFDHNIEETFLSSESFYVLRCEYDVIIMYYDVSWYAVQ